MCIRDRNDKILFVISDMRLTALHDYILKDLDRALFKEVLALKLAGAIKENPEDHDRFIVTAGLSG